MIADRQTRRHTDTLITVLRAADVSTLWRYTSLFVVVVVFVIIIIIFDGSTQFPGNKKITLCNSKSTKLKLE